jgi:hypothetical protein
MKRMLAGLAVLGLAQAAGICAANADDNQVRLITGAINANGTSQFTTNTFTSTHVSTGQYLITFAPAVFGKTFPLCIVTPLGTAPTLTVGGEFVHNSPTSNCEIFIVNASTGAPTDGIFVFTASPATGNVDLN